MCMPHGSGVKKDNGFVQPKKNKHIQRVSQEEFERGDPNFIDERKVEEKEKKLSLCDHIFGK